MAAACFSQPKPSQVDISFGNMETTGLSGPHPDVINIINDNIAPCRAVWQVSRQRSLIAHAEVRQVCSRLSSQALTQLRSTSWFLKLSN